MDLKKIKEKNPGFEFSAKANRKTSKAVIDSSLKSNLTMDAYKEKYADQASSSKDTSDESEKEPARDKNWSYLKKITKDENIDFQEEPKASFFNEEGEEEAAED